MPARIDTMSPSFFAGFIGYSLTGTGMGFAVGAGLTWFALTALFVFAVAASKRDSDLRPELLSGRGLAH